MTNDGAVAPYSEDAVLYCENLQVCGRNFKVAFSMRQLADLLIELDSRPEKALNEAKVLAYIMTHP